MAQDSMKMISSSVSLGLGRSPLSLNQQIAGGSRSSVLLSRIDFEPCDNGGSKHTSEALRTKYPTISTSSTAPVHNGVLSKTAAASLQKIGGKPAATTNGTATTNGSMCNGSSSDEGIPEPRVRLHPPEAVWLDWREVRKIGAGLVNLGNTCFMNTVIQCLTYCPPLANYLLHQDNHCAKCKTMNFCMMCELQKHMRRALDKPGDVIKPIYIYQRLKAIAKHFQFGQQEDAHEFLRYVVDNLWKAALANHDGGPKLDPASKETTVVNEIFGGYHRSQVICMKCKEKSNTYDHFMDLILDIKNASSLEKALEKFVEPELLQNDNAYKCPRCNVKVEAQKRFTVHRPPNVATFQFKRFDSNRMLGGKITKHVSYPERLEMRPFMSDKQGRAVTYRLNAVLVHLGASCNSGHYFCFVRNSNGVWYLMDDSRVHQVSLGQVLNQQAYVLFYVRIPAPKGSPSVKKSSSAAALAVRNVSEPVRNGHVSAAAVATAVGETTPQRLRQPPPKSPSSPAAMAVATSPSVNGHPSSSPGTPLPLNRARVAFGISRPTASVSSSPTTSATKVETLPSSASVSKVSPKATPVPSSPTVCPSSSGPAAMEASLVPYAGDSSDSDSEKKAPPSSAEKSRISERSGGKGSGESVRGAKAASLTWHVLGRTSPSLSSESSTTSVHSTGVNSTTNWNVTDHEAVATDSTVAASGTQARKPVAEVFPGWTVKPDAGCPSSSSVVAVAMDEASAGAEEEEATCTAAEETEDTRLQPFRGDAGVIGAARAGGPGDARRDAGEVCGESGDGGGTGVAPRPVPLVGAEVKALPVATGRQSGGRVSATAVGEDTDDSSDSHEWVERTKETLAAEKGRLCAPAALGGPAPVHRWDDRTQRNGGAHLQQQQQPWNGNNKRPDVVGYLQDAGSKQYGYAVNGWGNRSHSGYDEYNGQREYARDKRKYYDGYSSYDDEYDKGKKRKNGSFGRHQFQPQYRGNPFQDAQNFRNQQGRFQPQFERVQKRGCPPSSFYHRNNNNGRRHMDYGGPRRNRHHFYGRTR